MMKEPNVNNDGAAINGTRFGFRLFVSTAYVIGREFKV